MNDFTLIDGKKSQLKLNYSYIIKTYIKYLCSYSGLALTLN